MINRLYRVASVICIAPNKTTEDSENKAKEKQTADKPIDACQQIGCSVYFQNPGNDTAGRQRCDAGVSEQSVKPTRNDQP